MIANCGHDEKGGYRGGKASDQTGTEWYVRPWYNRPWNCVIRYPDLEVAKLMAELAREGAENDHIGYDQNERDDFWIELKKVGYHPKDIKVDCETDCSAGVVAIIKAAGHLLGISALQKINATYTGNLRAGTKAAGFKILTESKYLTSDKYLLPGDILLNDSAHTTINLDAGSKMKKKYPDISNWHPVQDWAAIKYQCPFLISKATEGTDYTDPTLKDFVKNCEKYKIPYYLYTFLRKGNELAQAKFMVKKCKDLVGDMFRGYVLDAEMDNAPEDVAEALKYIESLPYKAGLYAGYKSYNKYKAVILGRAEKTFYWEAIYGKNTGSYSSAYPPNDCDLHQYTSKGEVPGLDGGIDLNRLVGKKEAWFIAPLNEKKTEKAEEVEKAPEESKEVKLVKALQTALNAAYGLSLKVDGIFGKNTKNAVDKHYLCYQLPNLRSAHVSWMQEALNGCGASLKVDGVYGTNTHKALKAFQTADKTLTCDGLAGVLTHTRLIERLK